MRTVHQHLHLQHRHHTGRVLRHKHTSYRALALIIVLSGLLMLGLNMMARATAATLNVYASHPAPIPTEAPTITEPADRTIVHKSKLLVTGTCPLIDPNVILVILDNGQVTGSVICDTGEYAVPIVLDVGTHVLVARTYTVTDDAGPDSAPVTVRYLIDTNVKATDSPAILHGEENGLQIAIDKPFIIFGPARDAIWTGTITGGTLPYKVSIDWGDGTSQDYRITKRGAQEFTHHYRAMRPHLITLDVTDASGRGITKSYAAVTPYAPPAFTKTPILPWGGSIPLGLYGAYLLLLAFFGSLWVRAHPTTYVLAPVPIAKRRTQKRTGQQ